MAISYISGQTENIAGGTIANLGRTTNNYQSFSASTANSTTIGSRVVDSEHTNTAINGFFAHNNSRPISKGYSKSLAGVAKNVRGSVLSNNDAKVIRSQSTSSAIREGQYNLATGKFTTPLDTDVHYLCPDNSLGVCFQDPLEVFPDIPYVYNQQTGQSSQQGIMLRVRAIGSLTETWNNIYVPQSLLTNSSVTTSNEDGSTSSIDMYTIDSNNFADILPNGEYNIQYDTAIQNAFVSLSSHEPTNSVVRINSKANITDSRISGAMFKFKSEEAPKLLPYDGNPNQPNYAINSQNTAIFNEFIYKVLTSSYTIATNSVSGLGIGAVAIPYTIRLTNATTLQPMDEYYTVDVVIHTQDLNIVYKKISIYSRHTINGSNLVIIKENHLTINGWSDNIGGWLAPSLYAAHNAGSY